MSLSIILYDICHTTWYNIYRGIIDECITAVKTERLSCRITPEGKNLLEHVAACHGMSVSDYVVSLALDAASREIMDEHIIRVPAEKWNEMLTALDADIAPADKLTEAMRQFNKGTFNGDTYRAPD